MLRLLSLRHLPVVGAVGGVGGGLGLPPEQVQLKKKLETDQQKVGQLTERFFQTESRRKEEAGLLLADVTDIHRAGLLDPADMTTMNGILDKVSQKGYVPSKSEIQELVGIVKKTIDGLNGQRNLPRDTMLPLTRETQATVMQFRIAVALPPVSADKLNKASQALDHQLQSVDYHLGALKYSMDSLQQQHDQRAEAIAAQGGTPAEDPDLAAIRQRMKPIQEGIAELTKQKQELEEKAGILKPYQDQMDRPGHVNESLRQIRGLRDTFAALADKFSLSFSDRVFNTIDSATVKTFGRVETIRGELDAARDKMKGQVDNLLQIYQAKGGSPGAVALLQTSADILKDLNANTVDMKLVQLRGSLAILKRQLDADVAAGKLPASERMMLLTLTSNIEKGVEGYAQGMRLASQRKFQIEQDLVKSEVSQQPRLVKQEVDTLVENQNRLKNFEQSLKSPLVIEPGHVDDIERRASNMKQEMIADLRQLHRQFSQSQASPEALTFISLQINKLEQLDDPDALAAIREMQDVLKRTLTPEDLKSLQDIDAVVDKTIAGYQAFRQSAATKKTELEDKTHRQENMVAFIRGATETAGSGGSQAYALQVSVATPVPGLMVTGRGGYTFSFQRNSETGMIEVIHQVEGGVGVKGKVAPKTSVGGEIYGGGQTKYGFASPEDAGKFLNYLETGYPADYKVPTPTRVAYGGLKASVQAGLPASISVKGEAAVQLETEKKPNGDEVATVRGVLKGAVEVEVEGLGKLSMDAKITHKHKVTNRNDVHLKTQELTEVETFIGADVHELKWVAIAAELGAKWGLEPGALARLKATVEAAAQAQLGKTTAGLMLKVEFEGGKPVAVSVGVQAKTGVEKDVDLGLFDAKVSMTSEMHRLTTAWLSHGDMGRERLETYYLADEDLYHKTKDSLGWTGDTEIEGKKLSALETEWREKKEDLKSLKELKELYIHHPDRYQTEVARLGGASHEIQGKTISSYETRWEKDKGDRTALNDLKKAYLADRSFWRSSYTAMREERGLDSRTFLDGKALEQHEYEWSREYDRAEKLRQLERERQALA